MFNIIIDYKMRKKLLPRHEGSSDHYLIPDASGTYFLAPSGFKKFPLLKHITKAALQSDTFIIRVIT
jgi:hypothetical protein